MNTIFEGTSLEKYAFNLSKGELDDSTVSPLVTVEEQTGYFDQNDINDDGELGDELPEFYNEESLDNDFIE